MALASRTDWVLDPAVHYLNHGSYGAVPHAVNGAQLLIREQMERNPNLFFRSELPALLRAARARCAAELGTDEQRVAFVPNASQGVIAAAASVIRHGSTIATMTSNYGGVVLGLRALARRFDAEVRELDAAPPTAATPESCVAELMEHIGNADVLVLDQIVAASAQLNPVEAMVREVRRLRPDCFIVIDAAHVAGQLRQPIPAGVDAWVSNFHKWVAAPRPSAALVAVSERARHELAPLAGSWNTELGFPLSFDSQGTADLSAYLATPAAFDFLARWSWDAREQHCRNTVTEAAALLAGAWGVQLPTHPELCAPNMRIVPLPGNQRLTTAEEAALIVAARKHLLAEIAVTSPGGVTGVRLSAYLYNDVADYECLRDLPKLLSTPNGI